MLEADMFALIELEYEYVIDSMQLLFDNILI